jgi:hypothetical protein
MYWAAGFEGITRARKKVMIETLNSTTTALRAG